MDIFTITYIGTILKFVFDLKMFKHLCHEKKV
jgi:hypothetical protein